MAEDRLTEVTSRLLEISDRLELLLGSDQYLIIQKNNRQRPQDEPPLSKKALLAAAEGAYNQRRARKQIFENSGLFGEPAWDILLDLYVAELRERRVSVSDACLASGVPPTTALRWLALLEEANLVERHKDPHDARRVHLELSESDSKLSR